MLVCLVAPEAKLITSTVSHLELLMTGLVSFLRWVLTISAVHTPNKKSTMRNTIALITIQPSARLESSVAS